jgi:glyoxylase-like metal-dependent hydrolase (beta-lactamase superfamily II)
MNTLKVTEWVSENCPLHVRSAIIEGATELALVDAQFTKSNALRLAADLLELGKPLRWVYLTHPHLDHFNGAALIRHVFPQAKFYAQPEAIGVLPFMVRTRQASLGAAAPGGAANLPAEPPGFFQPAGDVALTVDGHPVEILTGPGDHPLSSVVWVPEAGTVVTGDVVFSRTHAFTGDHRDIAGWLALVRRIRQLNPRRVIAGHAPLGARLDAAVLDEQLAWLEDFQAAIAREDAAGPVKAAMLAKYPGYANDFIFEFSYGVQRMP